MNFLGTVTEFFGWCLLINLGLMVVTMLALMLMRGTISRIHAGIFNLSEADMKIEYVRYLSNFKILVIVFNLAPYIALKLMA